MGVFWDNYKSVAVSEAMVAVVTGRRRVIGPVSRKAVVHIGCRAVTRRLHIGLTLRRRSSLSMLGMTSIEMPRNSKRAAAVKMTCEWRIGWSGVVESEVNGGAWWGWWWRVMEKGEG